MKSCSSTPSASVSLRRNENEKKRTAWNSRVSESVCVQTVSNPHCPDHPSTYRAVAARIGPPPPPVPISDQNVPKQKDDPPKPKPPVVKKDIKKSFKGVVVKKKSKVPEKTQDKGGGSSKPESLAPAKDSPDKGDDERRPAKKQKLV